MKRYIKAAIESFDNYDWKDILELALDETTDADVLKEFCNSDSSAVANAILSNPNVTPQVIAQLTDRILKFVGEDWDILNRIAAHPKTSKETLANIITQLWDYDTHTIFNIDVIFSTVASNPNTSLSTLRKLANYSDYDVRAAVAKNPNTSAATLKHMVNVDDAILPYVLSNPNVSEELLIKFSNSSNHWTREGVASNPNTPVDILVKLSEDESYYVRVAVAENPHTPTEVLEQLSQDDEWLVAAQARDSLRTR